MDAAKRDGVGQGARNVLLTCQVGEALRAVFAGENQVRHVGIMGKMPGARQHTFGKLLPVTAGRDRQRLGRDYDFRLKIPGEPAAILGTHEPGSCEDAT